MKNVLIALLFVVSACAGASPQRAVFNTEAGYVSMKLAAANYVSLDRCVENGPKVCSEQDAVNEIRRAVTAADATIAAAEETVRKHPEGVDVSFAVDAAGNAVKALGVVLATYNIGVK